MNAFLSDQIMSISCFALSNYGPTIYVQNEATKEDCQQVLWLYGDDHQITEVGTMNIFVFWKNEQGGEEQPLDSLQGLINLSLR